MDYNIFTVVTLGSLVSCSNHIILITIPLPKPYFITSRVLKSFLDRVQEASVVQW